MRLHEGRVAVITGAAGGIGREHALEFARHGAKVVVNDVGPAQAVVDEIVAAGGEAVANTDDISDWDGAKRLIDTALGHLRRSARAGQQRRHPARQDVREHGHRHVGRGDPGPPARHVRARPSTRWPTGGPSTRPMSRCRIRGDQHLVTVRSVRQPGPVQLRCGQGRDRQLHRHPRRRAEQTRHHRQRHRAERVDPDDRRGSKPTWRGSRRSRRRPASTRARQPTSHRWWCGWRRPKPPTSRAGSSTSRAARSPSPRRGRPGPRIEREARWAADELGSVIPDLVAKARPNSDGSGKPRA